MDCVVSLKQVAKVWCSEHMMVLPARSQAQHRLHGSKCISTSCTGNLCNLCNLSHATQARCCTTVNCWRSYMLHAVAACTSTATRSTAIAETCDIPAHARAHARAPCTLPATARMHATRLLTHAPNIHWMETGCPCQLLVAEGSHLGQYMAGQRLPD
jgi:hypothetical protein